MASRGKLIENVRSVVMHSARQLVTSGVTSGTPVDTMNYDDAKIVLNIGSIPVGCTLGVKMLEADTWNEGTAVPVTSADFGVLTSANDGTVKIGGIMTNRTKRWLFAQANGGGLGSCTINYGVVAELGKRDADPTGIAATFDVEGGF